MLSYTTVPCEQFLALKKHIYIEKCNTAAYNKKFWEEIINLLSLLYYLT
jgi:hypothetical protein